VNHRGKPARPVSKQASLEMIMKLRFLMVLAFVLVAFWQGNEPSQAQEERRVWAFYMGFWAGGASWDMQANVLDDRPSIGNYDSRDPGVAGTQIDQAKSAGIDGFVVSWYGTADNQTTTPVLNNMLDRAAERGFQVGAAVDAFSPNFNNNRDGLIASLNYLVYDRANHPAYLRYQGKPVIFFAFQSNLGFSAAEWQEIRNAVDPNRNTFWVAEGVNGCCIYGGAMDAMYAFNLAWANGSSGTYRSQRASALNAGASFYIPMVHPGWDESKIAARDGRPNPTSPRGRNNGQFLSTSFSGATASGANIVLIGTWNEFMENSHIEPSNLYGSNALDTLRPLIADWKGSAAPTTDAAPPVVADDAPAVQANTTVNVRGGAGTTFDVLGQISPGTWYPLIRQEGNWYVISFNGGEGFVNAGFVQARGATAAAPANAAPPAFPAVQANTRLNVRAAASTDAEVLGSISPGSWYAIIREETGWFVIDFNGREGFVSSQFVSRN
jgi:uncharacterized protein YgiM (DUF1202 family)